MRELPDFPTEITFKAICRNKPFIAETIQNLISENNIKCTIGRRESKKSNFMSYTITAVFPSEEILQSICSRIAMLEDVITII